MKKIEKCLEVDLELQLWDTDMQTDKKLKT